MLLQLRQIFLVVLFVLSALLLIWSWILYSYFPDELDKDDRKKNALILASMWTVVFAMVLSSTSIFMKDNLRSGLRFFGFGLLLTAFLITIIVYSSNAFNILKEENVSDDMWLKSYYGFSIVSVITAGLTLLVFLLFLLAATGKSLDVVAENKKKSKSSKKL